ncbi:hypothetical protein D3C75_1074290 [compost metagenome]
MQGGQQAVGRLALGGQGALGEEARTEQRDLVLEAGRGVVLDELGGTAAGEEHEHRIGLERGDLGQLRLELDFRER